jgi:hypothetical protein
MEDVASVAHAAIASVIGARSGHCCIRTCSDPTNTSPDSSPKAAPPAPPRNILAAFQGLSDTYTPNGLYLDRLTHTQRTILNHLNIGPPWPEQGQK